MECQKLKDGVRTSKKRRQHSAGLVGTNGGSAFQNGVICNEIRTHFPRALSIAELLGSIKRHTSPMAFRPSIVISFCLVLVLRLAGADSATPEKMSLNGLVANSPFGSARSGQQAGSNGGEPFEFRAVLEGNFFSIYETATRRSYWVEMNDPVNGFSVKGYDGGKESITMEYQGKAMTLPIKRAPAVAQVMQQPMPQPGSNGMMQPNNNPPGQVGPVGPTAVDQQRIQQIQEEIRRRRALRSQSMVPGTPNYGNGPQPINPGGSIPQPQPTNSPGPQPLPQKN